MKKIFDVYLKSYLTKFIYHMNHVKYIECYTILAENA